MMSNWTCFDLSMDGAVAHIRLNHPERYNAMTPAFWAEIPQLFRQLDQTGNVRAAVLSSEGKHFSAGMDLSVFADAGTLGTSSVLAREQFRQQLKKLQDSFSAVAAVRFPVIAAIQGGCIGAGVDLVTACCLRYCSREAWFCIQEINIGMMADVGTMNRMPKQIPEAVMRELAYTGDQLGAERAERLGFANGLFDDHAATVAGALAVAHKIAQRAPMAVAATKEMISYTRDHSEAESFAYLNALQPGVFDPEDIARAMVAQKTKKAAEFENLPAIRPKLG
jgi:enoyl-CoA hydratase